jgi:hypothetical protein
MEISRKPENLDLKEYHVFGHSNREIDGYDHLGFPREIILELTCHGGVGSGIVCVFTTSNPRENMTLYCFPLDSDKLSDPWKKICMLAGLDIREKFVYMGKFKRDKLRNTLIFVSTDHEVQKNWINSKYRYSLWPRI